MGPLSCEYVLHGSMHVHTRLVVRSAFSRFLTRRFSRGLCGGCPRPAGPPGADAVSGAELARPPGVGGARCVQKPWAVSPARPLWGLQLLTAPWRIPGGGVANASPVPWHPRPTQHRLRGPGAQSPAAVPTRPARPSPPAAFGLPSPAPHLQDTLCAQDVSPWPQRLSSRLCCSFTHGGFSAGGTFDISRYADTAWLPASGFLQSLCSESPLGPSGGSSASGARVVRLGVVLVFVRGRPTLDFLARVLEQRPWSSRLGFLQGHRVASVVAVS